MRPILLAVNQLERFYRGGAAIAALRDPGADLGADPYRPEEWLASTTTLFGEASLGLSTLADGSTLRAAVAADPEGWLGPAHVARFGPDPAVLVKLLDAGERLPVHVHPSRRWARDHLDCPYGKTEAWVVVGVRGAEPSVHLGFADDVDAEQLAGWVARQDRAALLGALNALPVRAGDAVLVPAGTPHAIGEGVFVVELQEPTDLSVLLEWDGFAVDGLADGHLGVGYEAALTCVDRTAVGVDRLDALRTHAAHGSLLPAAADPFFRADRPRAKRLEAGFAVLVALDGEGAIVAADGSRTALARGDVALVGHAVGDVALEGDVDVVRCRPPAADADGGADA